MSRAQLNSVLRSSARQSFTATAGQTTFTISGGYVAGSIDVYVNGVKLIVGSDYTATNGTTVTLVNGCAENDTVDVVAGLTAMGGIGLVTRQSFTATDAQTVFTIAGGYQPNAIDVFKNGVKLQNGIDVDVSSGTTITITTGCVVNDIIDVSANQVTGQTGVTNLSYTNDSTTVTVVSDTGADAILPSATTALAGVMSAADKTSLRNYGMKNRIINGGMDISQRGTSFAAVATNTYTLDRWRYESTNDGSVTITQNSDVPSGLEFQNSLRVAVTTADTSIASGQHSIPLGQLIEGYNIRDLIGRTFTLSFWVRSSKTGTHCVSLRNSGIDRSYISEYNVTLADTWQYKTLTITGGLTSAGTWNYTNGIGLILYFCCACGTTYQTTAGAWNVGNFLATSNQVNCLDTIGNIFAITGVQLELGSRATEFEHRLYGTELALCQRYCRTAGNAMFGIANGTTIIEACETFPPMRAAPSAAIVAGKVARFRHQGNDFVANSPGLQNASSTVSGVFNQTTGFTGLTGGITAFSRNAASDSEFILLSAEL